MKAHCAGYFQQTFEGSIAEAFGIAGHGLPIAETNCNELPSMFGNLRGLLQGIDRSCRMNSCMQLINCMVNIYSTCVQYYRYHVLLQAAARFSLHHTNLFY